MDRDIEKLFESRVRSFRVIESNELDLGVSAENAFGEAMDDVWNETGDDPLDLFFHLYEKAEDELNGQGEGSYRGSFPSRLRNAKGKKNVTSRVLDKVSKKLGIDPKIDFTHPFSIEEYDLGDEAFRNSTRYGEIRWVYELTANDVTGMVTRKNEKWSFVTERTGLIDISANGEEEDYGF